MGCYHPLNATRSDKPKANGKYDISFNNSNTSGGVPIQLPCGQCIGCRLERSRQWAIRCYHEASLYEDNCFITLTYNNENLPDDLSVSVREFQLFMKRLRKKYNKRRIRFFHCGEYGEATERNNYIARPHYHACLFNFDLPDKVLFKETNGVKIYTSQILSDLWGKGFVTVGDVTFESAAYVARYIMKKITGDQADEHYKTINTETGEIVQRKPEYITMSRRPGIGKDWFSKYSTDVYPDDFVVINGKKVRPPKYYDGLYDISNHDEFEILKRLRQEEQLKNQADNTPERLIVKEKIKQSKLKQLKRDKL